MSGFARTQGHSCQRSLLRGVEVSAELERARQRRNPADQPEQQLPGDAERQVLLAQLRACRSEAEAETGRLRGELRSCREEHAEFRLSGGARRYR